MTAESKMIRNAPIFSVYAGGIADGHRALLPGAEMGKRSLILSQSVFVSC